MIHCGFTFEAFLIKEILYMVKAYSMIYDLTKQHEINNFGLVSYSYSIKYYLILNKSKL